MKSNTSTVSILLYSVCIATTLFSLYLVLHQTNIKYTDILRYSNQTKTKEILESCDIFKGRWLPDPKASLYTNFSCTKFPKRNCFMHGREDKRFLNWRWKPEQCELPRLSAHTFLSVLQGKTMAFIGDSLARNQLESLLCLLSQVETPILIEKVKKNRSRTWEFPKHSFRLSEFWSQFLVASTEIVVNGTATGNFHIHLDKVDTRWWEKLPLIDYAVFSDGHWFLRSNYLYANGSLLGCTSCQMPNITNLLPGFAIRAAFRVAFKAINDCKNCKKTVSFFRTFSPSHYEKGTWKTGAGCGRTLPIGLDEVDRNRTEWEYRKIQLEEMEKGRREGNGRGNEFQVLDITEMMSMRVDGHPNKHWQGGLENLRDCLHWCLPGPIDTWNQLLLYKIISSQN